MNSRKALPWTDDCRWPDLAATTAYTKGCRCPRCRKFRAEARARQRRGQLTDTRARNRPRRPDDGVIDRLVVDRLVSGEATMADATYGEALEAARRAYGRDGWWTWCDRVLGLRSARIKAIADEMAMALTGGAM